MKLVCIRYSGGRESTLGILYDWTNDYPEFLCYTLEDEYRNVKLFGETRIAEGVYRLALRTFGGKHAKYQELFPDIHIGMIEILDVPDFTDVLMHCGNDDDDTDACLLVGDSAIQNVTEPGFIGSSRAAYRRIYPPIAAALQRGELVTLHYIDMDRKKLRKSA